MRCQNETIRLAYKMIPNEIKSNWIFLFKTFEKMML